MTMILESRSTWKARSPKQPLASMPSGVKGVKIHYTGGHVDPATLTNHELCEKAVRGIQNGHMDGNGWIDIGYSFVMCNHQRGFVGRGLHHLPAANGPGLNSGHYAILLLVGNSGVTKPTDDMLNGALDLIDYIRREGPAGKEVKGHRDGYATDCPGDPTYAWVKAGAPRPQEISWTEKYVNELPVLQEGSEGFDVLTLRGLLFERYVFGQWDTAADPTPDYQGMIEWQRKLHFDTDLTKWVKEYQQWKDLDSDGIVGKNTWAELLRVGES